MATFFNAAEVAKAAVEIERKGQAFYKAAAKQAENEEARKFFAYFAGEEAKHEQVFESMCSRLGDTELPAWATEEEYAEYLSALIDSHSLFVNGQTAALPAGASLQEAIRMALGFEKDSILFFKEMRELVPDGEKPVVQECIDEEKRHILQLTQMLR